MPYVDCTGCGRNVFMAAYWSCVEYCPHCDSELPRTHAARLRPPATNRRSDARRASATPNQALAKEP